MMKRLNNIKSLLQVSNIDNYENYHIHSSVSNLTTPDCATLKKEYAKRAIELGQKTLSSCEHGVSTLFIETYDITQNPRDHKIDTDVKLKFVFAVEGYYVDDRFEKDNANHHIMLMARNHEGLREINYIISEAQKPESFYYKPRVDWELLQTLTPENVAITTACLSSFINGERAEDRMQMFRERFPHFYAEVQPHHSDKQKVFNTKLVQLARQYNVPLISACDSHFIYPEQAADRDAYLLSKGISYPEESGWFSDYPDLDTLIYRYVEQGILSDESIVEAITNTHIVSQFGDITFDTDIKVPTMFPELTMDEKNAKLREIIYRNFGKYLIEEKFVRDNREKYITEIEKELDVIVGTDFADYFLLNYYIVKRAEELGGCLTYSGRGSAPGFLLCKFLNFTTIDRLREEIPLISERFATKERILESKSLFDIDFNLSEQAPFEQASKELLGGDEYCYPMCALGEYKEKSSFKMFARANAVPFDIANAVIKRIEQYEKDVTQWEEYDRVDDEDECPIDIHSYLDQQAHIDILEESKKYIGIYDNIKQHACGFLLLNKDLIREFGLTSTRKGTLVLNITGKYADKYKYLKNDFLIVSVVDLINKVFAEVGIENWKEKFPTNKIKQILAENPAIMQKIYGEENVVCINQVEQKASSMKCKQYNPKNISELTQFVAAVRPGFASNFGQFVARKKNEYGVKAFDDTLRKDYTDSSFVLFQENAMESMSLAGISMKDTYDIIKAISKKKKTLIDTFKEQFIEGFSERMIKESNDVADF